MAGLIKGITIEFGADTSQLNNALKKTQGTINKTQAELKQINRSLRFNPGNTTLLKQKFELLQQSVKETSTKLNQLRQMQQKMNAAGVDKTSAQYRELEREIIKTENQLKRAEGELKRFGSVGKQQALAVGAAFKSAGNKIKSAGRTITTTVSVYGVAGIYAGSKLIEMNNKQAEAENKLMEIYKTRMGVDKSAAKSTMELASALQKEGVVGDEVALSFAQQMATYSSMPGTVNQLLPAFENLLVQQKGLNGTQEDAVGLANMFGKAMMGQTGALKRAGISFTDAQAEVLKFGTEEEKAAMISEVITQNVGNMNKEFAKTDAGKIQQAKNALGDMGEEIGAILLPAVADLVSWLQVHLMPKIQMLIDYMKQHPMIAKFALAFAMITAALGPVLIIVGALINAIGTIISIGPALGAAFSALAGPIGIAIAAIAAAIAIGVLLYKNWDKIKAWAKKTWAAIKTTITNAANAIKTNVTAKFNALKTIIQNIWTNIKMKIWTIVTSIKEKVSSVFSSIKDTASRVWNGIKDAIISPIESAKEKVSEIVEKLKGFFPLSVGKIFSNLKIPHINISGGKAPYGIGGFGTKPTISVDWYKRAMGNPYLFSDATLFGAGESGDEVLYGRNNLMKDIAAAVAGANAQPIVMNVYGSDNMSVNELAIAVEQKLIQMTKRRTNAWQ